MVLTAGPKRQSWTNRNWRFGAFRTSRRLMSDRGVFYDASGRRQKRFAAATALFLLLNVLAAAALFATIQIVPAQAPLPIVHM